MRLLFIIITLIGFINDAPAQKRAKQIIKEVEFTEDKIILNNQPAFDYVKDKNYFEIKDLEGKILITGSITPKGAGKFSSIITFVTISEQFHNDKIIGRNDLIFAMCENNVFTKDLKIDEEKLRAFIKKYNQLDNPPLVQE
jgi:hypothetical protein